MNPNNQKIAATIINKAYIDLGCNAINSYDNNIKILLS